MSPVGMRQTVRQQKTVLKRPNDQLTINWLLFAHWHKAAGYIVLSEVCLQRRLIGVKSVEEGDQISHLEGYWQLLKQKGGSSGFASD